MYIVCGYFRVFLSILLNVPCISFDFPDISNYSPIILYNTNLGAQETSMVKKRGSMKSSKTSFLQALLV